MLFYLILALIPLWTCHKYELVSEYQKNLGIRNKYLFWSMFVVFAAIALRHSSIGTDTGGYLEDFLRFGKLGWQDAIDDTRQESGFVIFTKLTSFITSSSKIYQIIYTLIYFTCYYQFAKRLEGKLPFYFLFYFVTLGEFTFFLTGVRQCIAISLCLLSFRYVMEKKWYYFAAIMTLAFTFHHSVVLFFIVYPMANLKVTKYNMILYLIVLYFASTYLLEAQMYLNDRLDYNYEIEETEDSGMIFLLLISILSFLSYHIVFKSKSIGRFMVAVFNVNIVTLFFWFLRLQTRVAERPSFYFLPLSCVLFAYMLRDCKNAMLRLGIIAIPFLYYTYRFFTTFKLFVPYKTFFFE